MPEPALFGWKPKGVGLLIHGYTRSVAFASFGVRYARLLRLAAFSLSSPYSINSGALPGIEVMIQGTMPTSPLTIVAPK
jgi:hypothetical protein